MNSVDPIDAFLNQSLNKRLSLSALINAHSRLSMMQMRKGNFSYEEFVQTLRLSLDGKTGETGEKLESDIDAYGSLLYAVVLSPVFSRFPSPDQLLLQIKPDMVCNEGAFVNAIVHALKLRTQGGFSNDIVCAFENDAVKYLNSIGMSLEEKNPEVATIPPPVEKIVSCLDERVIDENHESESCSRSFSDRSTEHVDDHPHGDPLHLSSSPTTSSLFEADQNTLTSNSNKETPSVTNDENIISSVGSRHNPVSQFLSQIRRYGMVVLLPQELHDQMLMCFFVVLKLLNRTLAHRDLTQILLDIKESGHVPDLQPLSATKIRGVLQLLKQAEVITSKVNGVETTRLTLSKELIHFVQFRHRHDEFLLNYMVKHRVYVPDEYKHQLVWEFAEEKVFAEYVKSLENKIADLSQKFAYIVAKYGGAVAPSYPSLVQMNGYGGGSTGGGVSSYHQSAPAAASQQQPEKLTPSMQHMLHKLDKLSIAPAVPGTTSSPTSLPYATTPPYGAAPNHATSTVRNQYVPPGNQIRSSHSSFPVDGSPNSGYPGTAAGSSYNSGYNAPGQGPRQGQQGSLGHHHPSHPVQVLQSLDQTYQNLNHHSGGGYRSYPEHYPSGNHGAGGSTYRNPSLASTYSTPSHHYASQGSAYRPQPSHPDPSAGYSSMHAPPPPPQHPQYPQQAQHHAAYPSARSIGATAAVDHMSGTSFPPTNSYAPSRPYDHQQYDRSYEAYDRYGASSTVPYNKPLPSPRGAAHTHTHTAYDTSKRVDWEQTYHYHGTGTAGAGASGAAAYGGYEQYGSELSATTTIASRSVSSPSLSSMSGRMTTGSSTAGHATFDPFGYHPTQQHYPHHHSFSGGDSGKTSFDDAFSLATMSEVATSPRLQGLHYDH